MSTIIKCLAVFALLSVFANAQDEFSFDLVDTNNDNRLSEQELVKFMRKRGRPDGQEMFAKFDQDRDGFLDISEFVPLVFEMSRRPVDLDYEFFRKMDINDDGIVDKAEAELIRNNNNARIIDGILSVADVNNDGQLTYKEFKSHLSGNPPQTAQEREIAKANEKKNAALQLLAFIDANADNRLDKNELYSFSQKTSTNKVSKSEVEQVFKMLDTNKDGFLNENELLNLADQMANLANVRSTIPRV